MLVVITFFACEWFHRDVDGWDSSVCVYGAFVDGISNNIYGLMLVEEVVWNSQFVHTDTWVDRWINNPTVTYEEPQAA